MGFYEKEEKVSQIGYMCRIDFDYHLGYDSDGTKVYPSLHALRVDHPCVDDCGIIKVSVVLEEVIVEGIP